MHRPSLLFLSVLSVSLWFHSPSPASAQPNDTANFRIRNAAALNSSEDDYAPFVTPNGQWLYFTSSRSGKAKLYRSKWEAGEWGNPEPVASQGVNTDVDDGIFSVPLPALTQLYQLDTDAMEQLHVPTIGIMASGKRDKPSDAEIIDSDVYLFDISHDGLTINNVRPIAGVNTRRWESQPTIAPDGSFIIFSGDTSNGDDHKDLYISQRQSDGSFGPPHNMGATVNSSDREVSPFLAPDGRTLFFASDRSGGYGGADFYITQQNARGEWSTPKNLGPLINSSANELFFYGASRAYCMFVSDRDGGQGGFDLYEAAPNIFAPGYTMVQLTIMDTVANRAVSGSVKVTETRLGKIISTDRAEAERGIRKELPAGIGYRFEVTADGYPGTRRAEIPTLPADTSIYLTVNVGKPAPPPPPPPPQIVFNIEGINVPLFVSGYYRMNTMEVLNDLRQRQGSGDLKGLTYIADVAMDQGSYNQYKKMSERVEGILGDFVSRCTSEYFPTFLKVKKPEEVLEITVHGYADPRPILGNYMEAPVTFLNPAGTEEITIATGEPLDNVKLAGLRAYYAVKYLDSEFRKRGGDYPTMVEQGLIRWRAVSGSVDETSGSDLSEKRRIRVDFQRVGGR